jgi:hypothetical protein
VVFSEAIFNDPGVQSRLGELGGPAEAFQTNLKGFSEVYQLYRLRPAKN